MDTSREPEGGATTRWGRRLGALPAALRALAGELARNPISRRRAWILLAAFLVCGYAAWVLGYVLATPEIGVRCAFTPVVNFFDERFLYPPNQKPMQEEDEIVQVDDQPVANWLQFLRKMIQLQSEEPLRVEGLSARGLLAWRDDDERTFVLLDGEKLVRVVYERPGEPGRRVAWCRLGRSPPETFVPSVSWFFLKIGLFVVGAIVFWKRPEDRPAAQFFWLCIVSFGAFMGGYHWSRIVTQPVLILGFMLCAVILPAVTLHFYLVFPRPKPFFDRHRRAVLWGIYGPPAFFLLLLLQGYLLVRGSSGSASVLGVMLAEIYVYFAIAASWYLLSLLCLIHSFRTAATPVERNQVKWILLGVGASAAPIGYSLYLAFWERGRFGAGAATWPMFTSSVCVTLAYIVSITRYRLMQLDQLLGSGMVYFLVSTLSGLFYYGLVFAGLLVVGSQVGKGPPLHQVLIVSLAVLLLMGALDLIRSRLRNALERHFRREKHQLDRTLQRMSQAIEQLVDPPTLARRLLHTTAEMLSAPGGAVYLRQGEPPLYCLTESIGPPPPLAELSSGCPLVEALRGPGAPAQVLASPSVKGPCAPGPALRQLQFLQGTLAQGLVHEGQLLGLLVLGPRPGGVVLGRPEGGLGPYTEEDVQLLSAFAQMTVLALVSAEGRRTIEALNSDLKDKVEKIAEQQRRILALQSQLKREDRKNGAEEAAPVPPEGTTAPGDAAEEPLVGSSPRMQQLAHLVKRVAASSSAVLLRGESGTGKGVLAKLLHENSPRAGKPFVKVHCAALSAGLLESELFGHVKGAFTSAIRDKVGRFESAHGGTLFFDEIGDITLEVQTKLLRVLEEMTFERVGSSEPVQVDVRVIAATHRDLEGMIAQGRFREDLFFRLNVLPIVAPPLRERIEDVPELVRHFLRLYGGRAGKQVTAVEDDALAVLKGFGWPGNVRQLENAIERAVLFAEGPAITVADLPDEVKAGGGEDGAVEVNGWAGEEPGALSLPQLVSVIQAERLEREKREREQLVRALAAAGGNKAVAARALGLARSTLVSRLKKLGLS
jgi:transcriptional regulator with GAF, ATPase, and Fis domain